MAQSYWVRKQREAERARLQAERAYRAQVREQARLQRELERQQASLEKERKRLYLEAKLAEASELNAELDERDRALQGVLAATLGVDDYIDFESLKERPEFPVFDPRGLDQTYPAPVQTHPEPPGALGRLVPGAKAKYQVAVEAAEGEYAGEVLKHAEREKERQAALATVKAEHDRLVASLQEEATAKNTEADAFGGSL